MKPPFDDFPTLDDLFNFLAQYSKAERKALPAVVRKGIHYLPIHDIRLSGASLPKGMVNLVQAQDGTVERTNDPKDNFVTCFMIG